MRGSSLSYLIKEGWRNVYANRLMSFASIGVLMACLMLIGSAVLLSMNVNSMVGFAESQNEVVVFLDDDVSAEEAEKIELDLKKITNVKNVTFVSKEEALEEQKTVWKEAGALLEGIDDGENFLPDSFRLKLKDLSILAETTAQIEKLPGVEEISAPVEVAGVLTELQSSIFLISAIIIGILAAVSVVIISNTIKITIYNRRREINIMKFCGATNVFITLPFVVEGIIIGILAATMAFLGVWCGYSYAISWMSGSTTTSWLGDALKQVVQFKTVALPLGLAFLGGGSGIGAIGSLIFIRKHLKV
ncbi:MAG: permease-like cell division protein FtsX [Oscillospiraceae bacterium]